MPLTSSIIISTHDRPESLARAVDCILAANRRPEELIIVSDGADIDARLGDRTRAAGVSFRSALQPQPSLAASRNRGIELSTGDVLLLLDDDVVLPEDYLENLMKLYQADAEGVVEVVGGRLIDAADRRPARRVWNFLLGAAGQGRWWPRRRRSTYVRLPPPLRGKLHPTARLPGGLISIRRVVAADVKFDASLEGYSYGEDLDFSFRAGRGHAVFAAPALSARHETAAQGRPDMAARGRMYVANMMHIAERATEGGAGARLLLAYDFAGMMILYGLWALAARRIGHFRFARGMAGELRRRACGALRGFLCGY